MTGAIVLREDVLWRPSLDGVVVHVEGADPFFLQHPAAATLLDLLQRAGRTGMTSGELADGLALVHDAPVDIDRRTDELVSALVSREVVSIGEATR